MLTWSSVKQNVQSFRFVFTLHSISYILSCSATFYYISSVLRLPSSINLFCETPKPITVPRTEENSVNKMLITGYLRRQRSDKKVAGIWRLFWWTHSHHQQWLECVKVSSHILLLNYEVCRNKLLQWVFLVLFEALFESSLFVPCRTNCVYINCFHDVVSRCEWNQDKISNYTQAV